MVVRAGRGGGQPRLLERGRRAAAASTAGVVTTAMSITVDSPPGSRRCRAADRYGRTWKALTGAAAALGRGAAVASAGAASASGPAGAGAGGGGFASPAPAFAAGAAAPAARGPAGAANRPGRGPCPGGGRSAGRRRARPPAPRATRKAGPRAARARPPARTRRPGLRARRRRPRPPRGRAGGRAPPPDRPRRSTAKRSPRVLPNSAADVGVTSEETITAGVRYAADRPRSRSGGDFGACRARFGPRGGPYGSAWVPGPARHTVNTKIRAQDDVRGHGRHHRRRWADRQGLPFGSGRISPARPDPEGRSRAGRARLPRHCAGGMTTSPAGTSRGCAGSA